MKSKSKCQVILQFYQNRTVKNYWTTIQIKNKSRSKIDTRIALRPNDERIDQKVMSEEKKKKNNKLWQKNKWDKVKEQRA